MLYILICDMAQNSIAIKKLCMTWDARLFISKLYIIYWYVKMSNYLIKGPNLESVQ